MSCFDWFKRDHVGPHLYRKINHLEEENKALNYGVVFRVFDDKEKIILG